MLRFISRRTLAIVPTLLLVYTVVFFIAHATPGTPWDMKSERPVPPEVEENLNRKYNLDAPLPEQYLTYLGNAMRGDFGPSYRSRSQSVSDIIREFLPVSLQLGAAAMLVAVVLALPLGGLAAMRRGTWVDWIIVSLTTLGISLPSYVVASVLIVLSRACRRGTGTSRISDAASRSCRSASSAAARTAGPTDAVVIEPHDGPV